MQIGTRILEIGGTATNSVVSLAASRPLLETYDP